MKVTTKWFAGTHPQFNVAIATSEGAEPFIEIKGCRIVNGANGEFVSYPSRKDERTGKYWNHVYGSEKFNSVVLSTALASMPRDEKPKPARQSRQDDDDSSIPF